MFSTWQCWNYLELTAKHLQGECQKQGKDLSEEIAALEDTIDIH
jgi:hypothetical protein